MPKSKFSAFLSLLLVFLSGGVVGALSYRLYSARTVYSGASPRRPDPEEVRRRIVADLKAKVHIDDQQVVGLNKLMDETRDAWQQMRHKMDQDGRAIHEQQWQNFRNALRPDQQPLFDQWKADRDAEMRKRHEQEHKGGPGGPPRP
jgi:hypothetical protein